MNISKQLIDDHMSRMMSRFGWTITRSMERRWPWFKHKVSRPGVSQANVQLKGKFRGK